MRLDRKLAILLLVLAVPLSALAQRRGTRTATIPAGTRITVRMIDALSSDNAQEGQEFRGSLEYPVSVDGRDVLPRGADVVGHVMDVHRGGRLSDPGYLTLELTSIGSGSQATAVHTEAYQIKGESHTKSNVTKIGGGAALGAIIGGIAGGGKGAAIGAGAGAAAGTGLAVATGKKNATIGSEAVETWTTAEDAVVGMGPQSDMRNTAMEQRDPASLRSFTTRDRSSVRNCYADNSSSMSANRDQLPPGLARQLQQGGTLPPGLERRVQYLPPVCEDQMPRLPQDLERVVYMRRVMLIDRDNRILDSFDIDQ
jgi:outer membrane lipoprotein SlyB